MTEKIEKKSDEFSSKDCKVEYIEKNDVESLKTNGLMTPFVYSIEEKKVKRKIDRSFLPLVVAILFTQFIDKTSINTAAVMGLLEDTHITHDQFGIIGGIFYFGYLAFQIPNNYLIHRVQISKYMGLILIVWGVSFGCTSLATNFGVLAALRVILGFWEAVTYPCIFLLIAMFYRRHEQVFYISYMFLANAVATAFGGLIAYGIANMDGLNGISAWKYAYLIWGAITVALGILTFFFLPDQPKSKWFRLTPEEEKIVDQRRQDNGTSTSTDFNIKQIYEGLKDPRYYCFCALSFLCNLQNGSITIFSSQIIQEIGFTNLQSILLNIPNGASGAILISTSFLLSKRFQELNFIGMGMTLVSLAGVLILGLVPSGAGKLAGIYLAYACTPIYILTQTNISNNVKGNTKKVFYTSSQLVFYCLGNFVGPTIMTSNQAPRYMGAMLGYAAANIICFVLFGYVRWSLVRSNRNRVYNAPDTAGQSENSKDVVVDDRTDQEDLTFIYRP
ncbi:unnamed protein product [Absidia cylindrospora]